MKRSAALALLIGVALAAVLLATNDVGAITAALAGAGWAILIVVALHLPQTLCSALGWRAVIERGPTGAWLLYRLRWVRESVNALLPVAQIGGEVVRTRLLAQRGAPMKDAAASTIVDLSAEMIAQIGFTLIGVALLVAGPHVAGAVPIAAVAVASAVAILAMFLLAQRLGLFRLIERGAVRAAGRWTTLGQLAGLNDAVLDLYRQPGRIVAATGWHFIAWLLGALETYAALRVLDLDATLREATIVEALSQIVRSFAFLIPGALGVQEGGFVLIGTLFAISPQNALALSLIRRIRELALGLPGLALWHRMERRSVGAQELST